jgi:serine/threonine-protein kinase
METPETKRFGRYEIIGELGRGAMGVVYKARDPQIDRLVALKTVSLHGQQPDEEEEFRKRFLNEAQAAGRLHHPGIVAVFDVGEEPESREPFIVLEYVPGEALNRILKRERKLPLDTALQLAQEIAEALEYAHAKGVTHRDIKPGNILITQSGHAKIADFGIAKLNLAHFTVPGRVLGTPAYMAPEQLSGEGADGRSDLFSLGVILYVMVSGHSPFHGDSATTVCFKVANREPLPVSALDLHLPNELDAVISRAMAKDPKVRYQRGADFANDLRLLQAQLKPGSVTSSTSTQAAVTATKETAKKWESSARPAVGGVYALKLVQAAIRKAPVRDLILGAATVTMLAIVGVQSRLLDVSPHAVTGPGPIPAEQIPAAKTAPVPAPPSAEIAATPVADTPPATATPAASAVVRKVSAKAARKPASSTSKSEVIVVPTCSVELAVRHQFKDATLSVWVDEKLALTRPLHGAAQKHLVVFNGVRGIESETLKVPAGKHILRFQTQTSDETVSLSKTISADFVGGNDRTLQITFDKHNTTMHLDWQ